MRQRTTKCHATDPIVMRTQALCRRVLNLNLLFLEDTDMATGTVKWFNNKKGYGFITPDEGGQDVFVHISAVQAAGMRTLNEGAKISYELLTERGKTVAGNLKLA